MEKKLNQGFGSFAPLKVKKSLTRGSANQYVIDTTCTIFGIPVYSSRKEIIDSPGNVGNYAAYFKAMS